MGGLGQQTMILLRSLIFAVLIALSLSTHAKEEMIVGVLEEPQCKDGGGIYVRALYAKVDSAWQPLNTAAASAGRIPPKTTWVVSLRGKRIGHVETEDPGFSTEYDWTYPRERLLSVVSAPGIPSVPNQSGSFAGWCTSPRIRPLVVLRGGNASDPDNWKPFVPSQRLASKLFVDFKARNGEAFICQDPSGDAGVPFGYREKNVYVMGGYKNAKGLQLVTLAFKPRKDKCDGLDDGWNTQTFLVGDKTIYVGANVTFVDSGDYGANGTSELLFWYSGYNKDGYILLSPRPDIPSEYLRSEYLWHYH